MKQIRLIELFSGVGAQASALERLKLPFDHWVTSEWEVNAVASYNAIHIKDNKDYSVPFTDTQLTDHLYGLGISTDGKKPLTKEQIKRKNEKWKREVYNNFRATNNIGSIVNATADDLKIVDTDKYIYLLTYSFPCQDLSVAGKQAGMSKGGGTRSGMLWEVERLLYECDKLPQVLVMENVPQVHGKKFIDDFNKWINSLEKLGYKNFWKDLNAKDYGVAQNRNRTFLVSFLDDVEFKFPEPFMLDKTMKDYLEDDVDEKYYINNDKAQALIEKLILNGDVLPSLSDTYSLKNMGSSDENRIPNGEKADIAHTILARDYKGLNNYGSNGVIEKYHWRLDDGSKKNR